MIANRAKKRRTGGSHDAFRRKDSARHRGRHRHRISDRAQATCGGANVTLMGRRVKPLEAVAAQTDGLILQADASPTDQVGAAIAQINERFGPLDVPVCNAGGFGSGFGTLTDSTDEDWENSVQANLNTAMLTTRPTMPCQTWSKQPVMSSLCPRLPGSPRAPRPAAMSQ